MRRNYLRLSILPSFKSKHAYKPVKFFLEKYFGGKLFFELLRRRAGFRSVRPAFCAVCMVGNARKMPVSRIYTVLGLHAKLA